ncbi:MAG: ribosome maturation factor RimP [Holosporales bacterium]|jgi:ribosome maturation factor RimP|nr:ribosome maturation factor RimP [Holosporales bacterium]
MAAITEKIKNHVEDLVRGLGCNIVKVAILGDAKCKTIQIMIERIDNEPVTVNICESVSKIISPAIDVMDPIKGRYNLEISSPGIDRPLMKPADFIRFIGKNIVVKTPGLKSNRKVFKGSLDFADDHGIKLSLEEPGNEIIDFIYSEIKYAHIDGEKEF